MLKTRGFREQYNPDGVTGCAIGVPGTSGCAFRGGGSLSLPAFTGYKLQAREFRFFVPEGTRSVMFAGYAPQRAMAAFTMRYSVEPSRVAGLSDEEYRHFQATEKIDTSFQSLLNASSDQIAVHDGGGTIRFLGGTLTSGATTRGGWVYIRQIMGEPLYDIQIALDVDVAVYKQAYGRMQWDALGDPIEGVQTPSIPNVPPASIANSFSAALSVLSNQGEQFKAKIVISQTNPDVAANPKISVWLAFYVNGTFFFRTQNETWTSDMSKQDEASKLLNAQNSGHLEISTMIEFTENDLKTYGASVFVACSTNAEPFKVIGPIWS